MEIGLTLVCQRQPGISKSIVRRKPWGQRRSIVWRVARLLAAYFHDRNIKPRIYSGDVRAVLAECMFFDVAKTAFGASRATESEIGHKILIYGRHLTELFAYLSFLPAEKFHAPKVKTEKITDSVARRLAN